MINSLTHQAFQEWLEQALQAQTIQQPQFQLYYHIATCDHCRGIIIIAAETYPQIFPRPTACTCDQACDDLPSFIDAEQLRPPHTVLQDFPAVWWHILTCEACAELYTSLRITLNAEQTGAIVAPHAFSVIEPSMSASLAGQVFQASVPSYTFTFAREFLNRALHIAPQPTVRRYRSTLDTYEQIKILDDNPNLQIGELHYHFKLLLKTRSDSWSFVATLEPAFAGWLTIRLGQQRYRQKFDHHGMSTLNNLPNDQLLLIDGPALSITIDSLID